MREHGDLERLEHFRVDIEKALSGSDISGILVQPEFDKILERMVEYKNPLRQNLPRKPGSGESWKVRRRAAPGTTPAAFVDDTDTLVEDEGIYTGKEYKFKTIAAKGKVTRRAQATGKKWLDLFAEELNARVDDFKDYEEYGIIAGSTGVSAKQFDGLRILIPSTQQVIAGGTGTGPLTLALLDETIDKCTGDPDMLIMTKRTRRELNALLQISQRFIDRVEVKGGFKVMAYNDIPVFVSTRVVNTVKVDTNAGVTTAGSPYADGNSSSIYVLDTESTFIGELTKLTIQPLAKTTSQFDAFEIFCDEVLVVRNPQKNAKLIGINKNYAV